MSNDPHEAYTENHAGRRGDRAPRRAGIASRKACSRSPRVVTCTEGKTRSSVKRRGCEGPAEFSSRGMYEEMYTRTWEAHSTPEEEYGMTIFRHEGETRTQTMRNPKFDLEQEGEPKRKWRNPGCMGVVSGIVL